MHFVIITLVIIEELALSKQIHAKALKLVIPTSPNKELSTKHWNSGDFHFCLLICSLPIIVSNWPFKSHHHYDSSLVHLKGMDSSLSPFLSGHFFRSQLIQLRELSIYQLSRWFRSSCHFQDWFMHCVISIDEMMSGMDHGKCQFHEIGQSHVPWSWWCLLQIHCFYALALNLRYSHSLHMYLCLGRSISYLHKQLGPIESHDIYDF